MSEPSSVEQSPLIESASASQPVSPPAKGKVGNQLIHSLIRLTAAAQIGCFFLPWLKMLFATASGYQIQQFPGGEVKLVWAMPVTALLAIIASASKQFVKPLAQIAGATPFIALLYYCLKFGTDLLQILDVGAYLTLFLGAVLVVLASCLKKSYP